MRIRIRRRRRGERGGRRRRWQRRQRDGRRGEKEVKEMKNITLSPLLCLFMLLFIGGGTEYLFSVPNFSNTMISICFGKP